MYFEEEDGQEGGKRQGLLICIGVNDPIRPDRDRQNNGKPTSIIGAAKDAAQSLMVITKTADIQKVSVEPGEVRSDTEIGFGVEIQEESRPHHNSDARTLGKFAP